MALAIRMARGGRRNLPFYQIVVADKRMPRDGRYIERLGSYNPLLASDDERRVKLNEERIRYWLSQGAQPSHRVQIFLGKAGIMEMPKINETPKKSAPSAKTLERVKQKEEKAAAAAEAAKAAAAEKAAEKEAAAAAPEEAPAEAAAAPAEETAAPEAPAAEAEAKTEETAAPEAPAAAEPAEEKTEG